MARLNTLKAIENGRKIINRNYSMTTYDIDVIWQNSRNDFVCAMSNSFYLGYVQGVKAAKAEMKKGAKR